MVSCHALQPPITDQRDSSEKIAAKPLVATFESINENIFQKKCQSCHNPAGEGRRVLLDYVSLMTSPLELVIPGNADESGLILALEREDEKRMPPAEDGYAPLPVGDIFIIRQWIDNGALE